MSQGRGVRDALKSIVPSWLADRADDLNKGFKVLWVIAQMADGVIQTSIEGVKAALPGLGTSTALALLGASRRILRGLAETDAEYAARLRQWLTIWTNAASDETLLLLLQTFLGPDNIGMPVMRIVNRAGLFTTLAADGVTFTQVQDSAWATAATSWDAVYQPERAQWWSDIWLIAYIDSARWPVYPTLSGPEFAAAWGSGELGTGHQVPQVAPQGVASIIADMKGAHTFVQSIIFTCDTGLFVPGSLGGVNNPNGRWGNFSAPNATTRIQARTRTIVSPSPTRYWACLRGG